MSNIKIDITQQKFGRLTALESVAPVRKYEYKWLFRCECGKEKILPKTSVTKGYVKSCGCLLSETSSKHIIKVNKKHGMYLHPVYYIWSNMKMRCLNKNSFMYKNYGGRGIKVCDRWLNSFENFFEDMGDRPSPKHSIDRIDNNGNYEPNNCRWATNKEQSRNKSVTKYATYKGETKPVLYWCEELALSYNLIRERLLNGWTVERAFTTPVFYRGQHNFGLMLKEKGIIC